MNEENKLPAGEFATAQEACGWAKACIESYVEACNVETNDQACQVFAMLMTICVGELSEIVNPEGVAAMLRVMASEAEKLAAATAAAPGMGLMQ